MIRRCGALALAALLFVALALIAAPRADASAAGFHAEFSSEPASLDAGVAADLRFVVRDSAGRMVRFLQFVHERPVHLLVVSRDLSDFAHIHPELGVDDAYHVNHSFAHGGGYRLFADYTPPGSGTIVDHFDVKVGGAQRPPTTLAPDAQLVRTVEGVTVTLSFDRALRANEDQLLVATLVDSASASPVTDLQLYLGALAHFIIVSADLKEFIHAHPLETGEVFDPAQGTGTAHIHDPALLAKVLVGPSPSTIRAATSFPRAGRYKLWMQFQREGRVTTVPFVFEVAAALRVAASPRPTVPPAAIPINVSAGGYTPARIELRKGVPAVLAFSRPQAGNCGGTVVIPGLKLRRDLPVGSTVLVRFTPTETAEIPFTCGMGMMQGLIVVK